LSASLCLCSNKSNNPVLSSFSHLENSKLIVNKNDKDQLTAQKVGQLSEANKSRYDAVTLTDIPAIIICHGLYKKLYSMSMESGIKRKIFGFHSLIIKIGNKTPA
jgi:hypothetical protein